MRKPWRLALVVIGVLVGIASVTLNVVLLLWLDREPLSLRVWEPRDTFDARSRLNQTSEVGAIAAFRGSDPLAPEWVRCEGQEVTPAAFPELHGTWRAALFDAAVEPGSGTGRRLPDTRHLIAWDPRRIADAIRPEGLADRLLAVAIRWFVRVEFLRSRPADVPVPLSDADAELPLVEFCLAVRAR